MKYKVIMLGFGTVGQGFAQILIEKKEMLKTKYDVEIDIVGVSAKQDGSIANENGLNPSVLNRIMKKNKSLDEYPGGVPGLPPLEMIKSFDADILIEATPTNLKCGQPAADYCKAAFEKGMHVVTTNKGPAVLHYSDLFRCAKSNNLFFGIEGTVMSGTPVLSTVTKSLAGCDITGFRGILNGTTNYILTEMESGKNYPDVLELAQQLGYAETDPAGDVEGWDAAAKVAILTKVIFDSEFKFENIVCQGITQVTLDDIIQANKEGFRYKLIGEATLQNGKIHAAVQLEKLPTSDPLAHVTGTTNAITLQTDLLGPVTITGAGAGCKETGFALLSDILAVHHTAVKS